MSFRNNFSMLAGTVALCLCAYSCGSEQPETMVKERIVGVPFTNIHIDDNFWSQKIDINRTVTIPSALHQCDINGRFDNFALAAGLIKGEHKGDFPFDDTDPYKVIEGASYSLAVKYDPALDHRLDSLINLIALAQEPDGYLTTCVTNKCTRLERWWGTHRWEKLNSHELYNCGHMYEAAVAHYLATGKRTFLDVAIKNANLICEVFGPDEGQKHVPSGHPIVEMALVKLYNVTGEQKYLDLAKYFVEEAGRGTDGHKLNAYSQDHKPVLQQDEIVGHAVRAGYFYSGVADVTMLTQDTAYFRALTRIWNNMAGNKIFITGGIGSRAQGEGFGPNYELHNQQAYCETCASISNVYWNYRMFLATGNAKYVDVLERALYNGVISGVSLSGDKFFYDNPLESSGQHDRQEWFGCACCPGNITRFMASVPTYMYAVQGNDVFVNLYIQAEGNVETADNKIAISQTTGYPWEGDVKITLKPQKDEKFAVHVRIPGWSQNSPVPSDLYSFITPSSPYELKVNGKKVNKGIKDGYVTIERTWKEGDVIELSLPMDIRQVAACDSVVDDRGKLAIERGPIVYCLEAKDQPDSSVFDKFIPAQAHMEAEYRPDFLNGVVVIKGDGFTAIPYYSWDNRGSDEMEVWIPYAKEYAREKPEPTIASKAFTYQDRNGHKEWAWGVNDQWEPKSSSDVSKPYHYWWLSYGSTENLAYMFEKPQTVESVEVYWMDLDHYDGNFRVPESWKLYYKDGSKWKEVEMLPGSEYTVKKDTYNKVKFKPVKTTDLKLEAQLQKGESGGVLEWKVS